MSNRIEDMVANAELSVDVEAKWEQEKYATALLGKEHEDFLHSPVGRYVIGCANQDVKELEAKIAEIRPNTRWRRRRIDDLRHERKARLLAIQWLCQAVLDGKDAIRELEQPDE